MCDFFLYSAFLKNLLLMYPDSYNHSLFELLKQGHERRWMFCLCCATVQNSILTVLVKKKKLSHNLKEKKSLCHRVGCAGTKQPR